ncbi:hypothetical protein ACTXJC_10540 [Glutamicibacter ardleyensis]
MGLVIWTFQFAIRATFVILGLLIVLIPFAIKFIAWTLGLLFDLFLAFVGMFARS